MDQSTCLLYPKYGRNICSRMTLIWCHSNVNIVVILFPAVKPVPKDKGVAGVLGK